MKKYFILLVWAVSASLYAQDTYTNHTMVNTTDVFGSARYVGMGGAMGALGADMSAMSNNPAAIGLFRRNDFSVSMGGAFQDAAPFDQDGRGHYSFDQVGLVASFSDGDESYLNLGFNFQKKADFRHSFFAASDNMKGYTQAALLAGIYGDFAYGEGALSTQAAELLYDMPNNVDSKCTKNEWNRLAKGNLYGFDINISGNINNRYFLGVTMGIDMLRYSFDQQYLEERDGNQAAYNIQDYFLATEKKVKGSGVNFKLGTIIRPIEDSPFRFGVTVETPTWYTLTQEGKYWIDSKWKWDSKNETTGVNSYSYMPAGQDETYPSPDNNVLDFNVFSPWRFRASMASTIEDFLAWDVEYEYAMYDYTKMGYPRSYYEEGGSSVDMDKDKGVTNLTHEVINGVHNIRAGLEIKPFPEFAARIGYNYWSKPMSDNGRWHQNFRSDVNSYALQTDFINLSAVNMLTFGLGYHHPKGFYIDAAYKYRAQSGEFYAFDDIYQSNGKSEAQFMMDADAPSSLPAQKLNLDRSSFTVTLGCKF